MSLQDDQRIIYDIDVLASEMTAKPRALPPDEWQERCACLEDRLGAVMATSSYRHIFGEFEKIMLQAIRAKLTALRHGDEAKAARFGRLVGGLIEDVRADLRALLEAAKS